MSARHFNYFDDWKIEALECPKCHWLGTFEQGSVEHYTDQMDCACPKCDVSKSPILAVVLYPTLPELRANMDKPGVREWTEQIDRGFDKFEAEKLRKPSQLPDVAESSFELVWDFANSNPRDPRTLLKHGDVVVFSEPARYEEFKRFGEVCEILKAKYGERIKDLVPTLRSEDWLYGAANEGKNSVEWFRHHCFGVSLSKQWQSRSATESLSRSLRVLEVANQHVNQDDSQPQLAFNFDAESVESHKQERDQNASNAPKTMRPVPRVPGASWEQTEYGTKLVLEPNSEFDSLPKETQDEMLDRMLQCFDKPNHIQRVTALRNEFADELAQGTPRPPADRPSAFSSFRNGPELPDIDGEEFTLVLDYSNDRSKYFVLYGEQVILSGPAANDLEDHVTDNALGGQFVDIAIKLKKRYGTKLVDLVPTPKAANMLTDLWGWALHRDSGRRIAQQRSIPSESPIASKIAPNQSESRETEQTTTPSESSASPTSTAVRNRIEVRGSSRTPAPSVHQQKRVGAGGRKAMRTLLAFLIACAVVWAVWHYWPHRWQLITAKDKDGQFVYGNSCKGDAVVSQTGAFYSVQFTEWEHGDKLYWVQMREVSVHPSPYLSFSPCEVLP